MSTLLAFVVLFVIFHASCSAYCPWKCECNLKLKRIQCDGNFPNKLPVGIYHVSIHVNMILEDFDRFTFKDITWTKAQTLNIYERHHNPDGLIIRNWTFENLNQLQSLTLGILSLNRIEPKAFSGLPELASVVFSNNRRMSMSFILQAFNDKESFPHLMSLELINVNVYMSEKIKLNESFFDTIAKRNISRLKVDCKIEELVLWTDSICSSLKMIDLSNSFIHDIRPLNFACPSIEDMDISDVIYRHPFGGGEYENVTILLDVFFQLYPFLADLKGFRMNGLISDSDVRLINVTLLLTTQLEITSLSVQNNRFEYIDIFINTSSVIKLQEIHLQNNFLEYFKLRISQPNNTIVFLNFSNNNLGKMQREDVDSFAQLSVFMPALETVDLSENGLENLLPPKMFNTNRHLKHLYLRNNHLTQLHFSVFIGIETIDLASNSIKFFNYESIKWIQAVYDLHMRNGSDNFIVNLQGNPLRCSCESESLQFLDWVISSGVFKNDDQKYSCSFQGDSMPISEKGVADIKNYCSRSKRILTGVFTTLSVIVALITVVCLLRRVWRKTKSRKVVRDNIQALQEGRHDFKYPVFLSYSSINGDVVLQQVYPYLLQGLKDATGVQHRNLVCTGETHFKPGFRIHDEIIRCLSMSSVFIAVISENYCQSSYCRKELDIAYAMEKPILQVYLEDIEHVSMWPLLQHVFKTYTRIKVTVHLGDVEFHPDIESVCESVLQLM